MKQPTSRQQGFSITEAVIIILVTLALAFGGWWVWQKNKNNTPTETASGHHETTKPADPSENGKYLVIKEWGVRFPLPEGLKGDVTYGVITSHSTDQQSAHLAIGKIDRLPESNCDLRETTAAGESGKGGGVVDIQRRLTPYDAEATDHYEARVHIGDHWYYVASMRDACFKAPDNEFVNLIKEIESLAVAAKDLKPIDQ